jgi:hypothetical protein
MQIHTWLELSLKVQVAHMHSLFLLFIFIEVIANNPALHKCVDKNDTKSLRAFSLNEEYLYLMTIKNA